MNKQEQNQEIERYAAQMQRIAEYTERLAQYADDMGEVAPLDVTKAHTARARLLANGLQRLLKNHLEDK